MAKRVGVRELKEHASEIMRRVRDERETYVVTYHGKGIARIVPSGEPDESMTPEDWLDKWDELGKEISAAWPSDITAIDAVREQRRDL